MRNNQVSMGMLCIAAAGLVGCSDGADEPGRAPVPIEEQQPYEPSAESTGGNPQVLRPMRRFGKRHWPEQLLHSATTDAVVIKLPENSGVAVRGGGLESSESLGRDVASEVNRILRRRVNSYGIARLSPLSEDVVRELRASGERSGGQKLPDLNLWVVARFPSIPVAELSALLEELNASELIEAAEPDLKIAGVPQASANGSIPEGIGSDPGLARSARPPRPRSPVKEAVGGLRNGTGNHPDSLDRYQAYLGDTADGFGLSWFRANTFYAYGETASYVNVDGAFTRTHHEFLYVPNCVNMDWRLCCATSSCCVNGNPNQCTPAPNTTPLYQITPPSAGVSPQHGTGTLGIVVAGDESLLWPPPGPSVGTTGMVPFALTALAAVPANTMTGVAQAVAAAWPRLYTGGTLSIQWGPWGGGDCNGNGKFDDDDVPPEYLHYVWDAIHAATQAGVIVVENAGNAGCQLDLVHNYLDTGTPLQDSGAIIVGGSSMLPGDTYNTSLYNYGQKVDVHARAGLGAVVDSGGSAGIYTSGCRYQDSTPPTPQNCVWSTDSNHEYQRDFSGTSSTTPQIAGVTLALNSALLGNHGSIMGPIEMRELLRHIGKNLINTKNIGMMPDMKRQWDYLNNRQLFAHSTDFDGDGRTDYAVWNPATGRFSYSKGVDGAIVDISSYVGRQGDIPITANFVPGPCDGYLCLNNRSDFAVFRPSDGKWIVRDCGTTPGFRCGGRELASFGWKGDVPLAMKYDNNPIVELVAYTPASSQEASSSQWGGCPLPSSRWLIRKSATEVVKVCFGADFDQPLVGDFNGDGLDDIAVYRYVNATTRGEVRVRLNNGNGFAAESTPHTVLNLQGLDASLAMASTYRANGRDNFAVWSPLNSGLLVRFALGGGESTTVTTAVPGVFMRFADRDRDGTSERVEYNPWTGYFDNELQTHSVLLSRGPDQYALSSSRRAN